MNVYKTVVSIKFNIYIYIYIYIYIKITKIKNQCNRQYYIDWRKFNEKVLKTKAIKDNTGAHNSNNMDYLPFGHIIPQVWLIEDTQVGKSD